MKTSKKRQFINIVHRVNSGEIHIAQEFRIGYATILSTQETEAAAQSEVDYLPLSVMLVQESLEVRKQLVARGCREEHWMPACLPALVTQLAE